ncbi:MAG: hypothetical protein A2X23_13780 [Chloroflexi bacterium GWC2_73_18]|nr:MAG: hypothetical protein A2X23_13780 [Chloroflexi bacterium GWC2_73_18]
MADTATLLAVLVGAALVGVISVIAILARRDREVREREEQTRYAASTEGMSRCPHCGRGNLVGAINCVECGRELE